ncbi:MAG: septum formation initiator family protein [Candidatus Omnitrophica bacterium]|nr:septum formation initiator family protein [Candidatus Omnitrophota bacterium]
MKVTVGKTLFLLVLLAVVLFPTYSRVQKLKAKDKAFLERVERLKIENERLTQENRMLRDDPVYIEEVAREKLKVARENEIVFRVINEDE